MNNYEEALRDIAQYGKEHPGFGWNCAEKAEAALRKKEPLKNRHFVRLPKYTWVEYLNAKGEVVYSEPLKESLKLVYQEDDKNEQQ